MDKSSSFSNVYSILSEGEVIELPEELDADYEEASET